MPVHGDAATVTVLTTQVTFQVAHGEKEGPRQRRQVEQLFVRPTSRKMYSCARVGERFVGRTEIEITATFVVEEADEEPLIGVEKDYKLDKGKCPICRSKS